MFCAKNKRSIRIEEKQYCCTSLTGTNSATFYKYFHSIETKETTLVVINVGFRVNYFQSFPNKRFWIWHHFDFTFVLMNCLELWETSENFYSHLLKCSFILLWFTCFLLLHRIFFWISNPILISEFTFKLSNYIFWKQCVNCSLTLPETFDGPLRANNRLSEADHLFVNELIGPESLAIWKGIVYRFM